MSCLLGASTKKGDVTIAEIFFFGIASAPL
jgi:hypothetical protein